jgi:DNA-binding LacI/PurR family transcriptional regulator
MPSDRPTLDTVAQAAGVSRMTVSNAYNRPDQLSAATREHVLQVAATLGYPGPDPAGRSLRRRRVDTIGVLLTERLPTAFTDPGLVSLMRGLSTELGAAGQAALLVPAEADLDGSLVRNALVDGFVLCSMGPDDPSVAAVVGRRLPVVTVGSPRLPGVPHIAIDNRAGGALAGRHLAELGHRRLGVVTLPGREETSPDDLARPVRWGARDRLAGFTAAAVAAGVAETDIAVADARANTVAGGREAVRALLDVPARRRPTAVFGVTDVLALGVVDGARDSGLRVPTDLSVVGFDDIPEAARAEPALTTVAQSLAGQGQAAAHAVLELVAGRRPKVPRFAAELVVRHSSASPRSSGRSAGRTS